MFAICRAAILGFAVSMIALTPFANGDLVTIDFDSFTPTTSFSGGVEDGFLIDAISGPVAVSGQYLGPFSLGNSIHHQSPGVAVFELSQVSGDLFQLESFRAGSTFESLVPFTVSGFVGGTLVGSEVYTPTVDSYQLLTAPSLQGVYLDRVVFDLGNAQIGPTHIDDIVVNTIPEPPLAILGFALLGLAFRRRR